MANGFAFQEPPALVAFRQVAPTLAPRDGLREFGRATLAALEGVVERVAELSAANELSHAAEEAAGPPVGPPPGPPAGTILVSNIWKGTVAVAKHKPKY